MMDDTTRWSLRRLHTVNEAQIAALAEVLVDCVEGDASVSFMHPLSRERVPQPIQIVEVHFPPGGRVAFETGARDARVHQQVWVLEGAIDITVGDTRHALRQGDCLAMQLDQPTMFHNPTRKPARYAVVIATEAA